MKASGELFASLVVAGGLAAFAPSAAATVAAPAAVWQATTWNGERAYELATAHWRAVVSIERGRLVHFGPAGSGDNFLHTAASRSNALAWGGHRVWFGPQSLWGWPPPAEWESSAAAATVAAGRLELAVPDAGRGFPRMTRIYQLADGRLDCRVRAEGGTRSVQVMQILQTGRDTVVELRPARSAEWPRGYTRVGTDAGPALQRDLAPPACVTEAGDTVVLRYAGSNDKLGFPPQAIRARIGGRGLVVGEGSATGPGVAAPDAGFYTQVYVGLALTPVVELEQLSPQWPAGATAEFSMLVGLE